MPEIRYQQLDGSPEVSLAEIHIADDSDFGTGTFKTVFNRNTIGGDTSVHSIMVNPPRFQISVNVNAHDVTVWIGTTEPMHQLVFALPPNVSKRRAHTVSVEFAAWRITATKLDGKALELLDAGPTEH